MRLRALAAGGLALLASGCTTAARTTTEYDPGALAVSAQWTGVFWTAALVCTAIVALVWIVAYYRNEARRNSAADRIDRLLADLDRERDANRALRAKAAAALGGQEATVLTAKPRQE